MKFGRAPNIKIASRYKAEMLFSFVFTFILTAGYFLSTYATLDVTPVNKWVIVADLLASMVVWGVLFFSLTVIRQWSLGRPKKSLTHLYFKNISDSKLWLLTSLIIFVCYLPILLASLSMLSPDSWNSIGQVTGAVPLNNANPLIFTAFVGIFIELGRLLAGIELGTVLFAFFQSAVLAVIFARIIVWMRNEGMSKSAIVTTFLFYAILPINSIAGLIMWKDILFAGFGLMLLLLLRQLDIERTEFFSVKKIATFIAIAFLFCTWRNNGIYAYELFVVLAIIINYQTFLNKKYVLLLLSPLVLTLIYLHAIKLPTSESVKVSIPLQQIARTVKYESSSISTADQKTINEILPFSQLSEKYNPRLSDPVMNSFNEKAFAEHESKYFNVWLRLLKTHKKTYIAAFVYNNYGYLYPFYLSSTPTDILLNNANHPNALKGYKDTAYRDGGKFMTIEYRNFIMRQMPFLQNIGFYSCVILLGAYVAIIRRRQELIGVFIVLFGLFLTTIFGPVNSEFRYLYLFVVATPFIIAAAYSDFSVKRGKIKRA